MGSLAAIKNFKNAQAFFCLRKKGYMFSLYVLFREVLAEEECCFQVILFFFLCAYFSHRKSMYISVVSIGVGAHK